VFIATVFRILLVIELNYVLVDLLMDIALILHHLFFFIFSSCYSTTVKHLHYIIRHTLIKYSNCRWYISISTLGVF